MDLDNPETILRITTTMQLRAIYPSPEHQQAAEAIVEFFSANYPVEAVLLVNSCARGKATRDSCLDMLVLARPEILSPHLSTWEKQWADFNRTHPVVQTLERVGRYSQVHLDFSDGVFVPREQDEAAGPDSFEIEIGNFLVYSLPLWQGSDYLTQVKEQWLPYYAEPLRRQRLSRVRFFCLNNLHHIPLYLERGLYFQCFDRLYNAYQEFLQALFISRRTYPIAYNKWIQEQLVDILRMPDLYRQVSHLFEIEHFESREILDKAQRVEQLLERYAPHV
jgi:predicted nucleotidyltransferase